MTDLDNLLFNSYNKYRVHEYVITSKERDNYETSNANNFRITLDKPLNFLIIGYSLESACIPKTMFNINQNNNYMLIADSIGLKNIFIPVGNYNITNFISEIKNVLNTVSVDTYDIILNNVTNKITITSTFNGFTIDPNADSLKTSLNTSLGFKPSTTYVGGSIIAPNIVNISGINNVYINVKQLTKYMSTIKDKYFNFKVNMSCPYGSIVYFNCKNTYNQYYTVPQYAAKKITYLDISLVDEEENLVDLNGSDWSFILKFIKKDFY